SKHLVCPVCSKSYEKPGANTFSFNSPIGACPTCRGFGRIQGIDYSLVIPDTSLSLEDGAIKPWTTPANRECFEDMMRYAPKFNVRTDVPFAELTEREKSWVIDGETGWSGNWRRQWYGLKHFFEYLETKTYKMHIAVLLSRYRTYLKCPTCLGARLKDDWLAWRVGDAEDAKKATAGLSDFRRFKPRTATFDDETLEKLPGLNIYDLMRLPLANLKTFADALLEKETDNSPARLVLQAISTRLTYLNDVGLGYLTLDRQSRTLSGGEVQRIALTTALGTSLVNTLFVLDEPSVGLHPQDMQRINGILKKIRDAGNTLVIVEHDPDVMLEADFIYDMGPGPGDAGGEIVFQGTPAKLLQSQTLTGRYLRENTLKRQNATRPIAAEGPFLELKGATEHNLKNIDVRFPHARFSVVTGVSGSGKSTLIENVLVPALKKARHEATEAPGAFRTISGFEAFEEIVFVDQSALGRTSRSNPVSYVGAFDAIRKLFVKTETAQMRGYTPGTFSFNSGDGRCPVCGGNGFERVEMMFLSDVYLTCPECSGKRYRPEILEVTIRRGERTLNIADVLDLTVDTACELFADDKAVIRLLEPLRKVGLGYLKLGQPVPTLSGGEAQRLKIAGFLAQNETDRPSLYLFDEPTTGLHFADIAKLLASLNELVDAGHTVIVIEHNLDVIAQADWVVDLGPEGGDAGGTVVYEGSAKGLVRCERSHTAQALTRALEKVQSVSSAEPSKAEKPYEAIEVRGAREHNLKNISVDIPHNRFTVVTGVSGSGKSTLAFDVIFKEGQRRYLESLNAYARSVVQPASKPEVDGIYGIAPTVAIEQRTSRGGVKSTVATMTEIYHFLRLLFVKLGTQYCPDCNLEVGTRTPEEIAHEIRKRHAGVGVKLYAPLVISRKGIYKDLAAWANKRGYSELRVDGKTVSTA
ncbi:MAG TPA: excinuclease ABC subunit A, partial [Sutterella sp.]|nr:excinuclease ABC subunit A [Sutterella sp.]